MFKINLVPEVQQQKQKIAKRNTVATIVAVGIIAVCVVTLFIIGAVKVAENLELNKTNKEIEDIKVESEQYKELEETVISLEEGLAGIKQILSGDNAWTKLLPHLEAATPEDVQYSQISLSGNQIQADLKGKNINSLARLIESYKNYNIVVLKGTAQPEETITVTLDEGAESIATVSSNGIWNTALAFNPKDDHAITIKTNQNNEIKLSYDANSKTLSSPESSISAEVKNLFSNIETTQYSKEGENISFNISFNFDSEAIW